MYLGVGDASKGPCCPRLRQTPACEAAHPEPEGPAAAAGAAPLAGVPEAAVLALPPVIFFKAPGWVDGGAAWNWLGRRPAGGYFGP